MATVFSLSYTIPQKQQLFIQSPKFSSDLENCSSFNRCFSGNGLLSFPTNPSHKLRRQLGISWVVNCLEEDSGQSSSKDEEVDNVGVKAALAMLRFYKREISPVLPKSCRFVPTCSEYSMIAYKKYGLVKGTILTAWRLCRCNPLGGSGFDPPRWFDESLPED
ncbi:hypothetical protein M9H77_03642 [Catharanthus roseus]|uniref:Uncharacterized protein n=1 Tax=Catharanthus roseus TaxID=4058 RepID=A0ACC0CBU3_CATRO|nr:hypothetical protein M9H77_03642 [Catharanthus roseus]